MSEDDLITVCDACEQASCWQGIFYCQSYKTAGIKQMTRAALTVKGLEHPSYWKTDQEWTKEYDADAHKRNEAARERRKQWPVPHE